MTLRTALARTGAGLPLLFLTACTDQAAANVEHVAREVALLVVIVLIVALVFAVAALGAAVWLTLRNRERPTTNTRALGIAVGAIDLALGVTGTFSAIEELAAGTRARAGLSALTFPLLWIVAGGACLMTALRASRMPR